MILFSYVSLGRRIRRTFRKTAEIDEKLHLKEKFYFLQLLIIQDMTSELSHLERLPPNLSTKWSSESSSLELLRKLTLGFFSENFALFTFSRSISVKGFIVLYLFIYSFKNSTTKAYIFGAKCSKSAFLAALFG